MTTILRHASGAPTRPVLLALVWGLSTACGATDPAETDEESVVELEAPAVSRIAWQPCGDDFPGAECAYTNVPLDYDRPRGGTTELLLARIPATDPQNRIGTLFINPGGPGGSGVFLALSGFGNFLSELLGGRFDVVGFDPRGIGGSDPLLCFDTVAERDEFVNSLPAFPYLRSQERPFFDALTSLADRCQARGSRITAHMSTADVVRDLDWLRQAVGDRRLNYLGFSYGSYIGTSYANLFPDKVRTLVIDGVLDPRLWSSGWQIKSDRVATDEVFDEFLHLCDEAGEDCALHAEGGAEARYDALAEAIKDAPFVFEDGFVYSYDFLILDTLSVMYAPEIWGGPEGFAAFLAFLSDAVQGDTAASAEAARLRALLHELQQPPGFAQEFYDNWLEGYFGNQCADTEYPSSFGDFRSIGRYAEKDSRFGAAWWWNNAGCASWPTSPDRYTGPWTARTAAPVLVVGNYFDPATDYAGAVASDELLRNSRLLSYAGWGHTAFGRSECVTDHVLRYLLEGTLPPRDTVCPANPNPFAPVMPMRLAAHTRYVGLPALRAPRR